MRVPRSRLIGVATVAVLAACAGNWISEINRPILCERERSAVERQVGPAGGRIDTGYAWIAFDANIFRDSTLVVITPHPRLHGIHVMLPTEDAMPAFDVGFDIDYCGERREDVPYYIVTEKGPRPATVERGVARARIQAGELSSRVRGAGFVPTPNPLIGGWVIVSN